mmetsp:Transcript_24162/g.58379  ORF Transcript_24162/g.58379 Transcript_24162/m.58379 type:complete len:243 (+) Transcript_24162:1311-2039(+)
MALDFGRVLCKCLRFTALLKKSIHGKALLDLLLENKALDIQASSKILVQCLLPLPIQFFLHLAPFFVLLLEPLVHDGHHHERIAQQVLEHLIAGLAVDAGNGADVNAIQLPIAQLVLQSSDGLPVPLLLLAQLRGLQGNGLQMAHDAGVPFHSHVHLVHFVLHAREHLLVRVAPYPDAIVFLEAAGVLLIHPIVILAPFSRHTKALVVQDRPVPLALARELVELVIAGKATVARRKLARGIS